MNVYDVNYQRHLFIIKNCYSYIQIIIFNDRGICSYDWRTNSACTIYTFYKNAWSLRKRCEFSLPEKKWMKFVNFFFRFIFFLNSFLVFRMNEWMKLTGPRGGNDTRLTGMRLYIYLFIYLRANVPRRKLLRNDRLQSVTLTVLIVKLHAKITIADFQESVSTKYLDSVGSKIR